MRKHVSGVKEFRLLDESLLDDVKTDEVEDVDVEYDDDKKYDADFYFNQSYLVRGIGTDTICKCIRTMTDKFSKPEEVTKNLMKFTFDLSDVSFHAFCRFVSALFCMTNRDLRFGFTLSLEYSLKLESDGRTLSFNNKRKVFLMFSQFKPHIKDEKTMVFMLAQAIVRHICKFDRKYNYYDPSSGPFVLLWNDHKKSSRFIVTKNGEISKCKYEVMGGFSNGIGIVTDSVGNQSFVNTDGNLLFNTWYEECGLFGEYGLVPVRNNKEEWNFVDKQGNVKFEKWFKCDKLGQFCNGYAFIRYISKSGPKSNYIDISGKPLMNKWMNYIYYPSEDFAIANDSVSGEKCYVKVPSGRILCDELIHAKPFKNGYAEIRDSDGPNILKKDGTTVFVSDGKYSNIWFKDGLIHIEKRPNVCGIARLDGTLVFDKWFGLADIISNRFVQIITSKNQTKKNEYVVDLYANGYKWIQGYCLKYYDGYGLMCIEYPDYSWNIMKDDGTKLFKDNFKREYGIPIDNDGVFCTSNGVDFFMFDAEGNIITTV